MSLPDDAPHPIPRVQFALFVTGDNGEPLEKLIQDLENQQVFTLGVLPAAVAAAQATADAALALLVPFVPVNHGGTGLTGGTSGGILAFVGPTTIASSALLAQHGIVLGGGAGAAPSTPVALGTAGYVLTSQGAGVDPVFAAVPGVASAALTKADDTNVTLTLSGTPGAALLAATLITVGWAGTLAVARGGTGLATLTAHALYVGNGAVAPTALAVGATNTVLHGNTGANPSFSAVVEADITLANNTTNDVSITKHGFAPKAPNDATKFLDGTGSYSVPAGSSGVITQIVSTQTGAVATATTVIPADDTIPTSTEGDAWAAISTTITPTNAAHILLIELTVSTTSNNVANANIIYALFQDAGAAAISVAMARSATSNEEHTLVLRFSMVAGTTSATTFKIRFGPDASGGTITVNGVNTARRFGGVANSSMTITEHT